MISEQERKFILKEMINLLDEYDYQWSYNALDKIIDEWAKNKAPLIEMFKKHPNYVDGKFLIAFQQDFSRSIDVLAIKDFTFWLFNRCVTVLAYREALPEEMKDYTLTTATIIDEAYLFLENLPKKANAQFASDEFVEDVESTFPTVHAHRGEKTCRIINKICKYLGFDKHPEYNREYGKFADALSPISIKRHTVLSINPLDYLTMSFGNSWSSCHTIDKNNKRQRGGDGYSGCYSSGTMSYMLDGVSMVFYTVDTDYDGSDYWTQDKINRQMFHFGEDKLIQSRLYPQSNDNYGDELYNKYRSIVQSIMSVVLDVPNLWTVSRGTSAASRYVESDGTHYRDYTNFGTCTLSRLKDVDNEYYITIGRYPICVECGCEHENEDTINCCHTPSRYNCLDCGCSFDDEDDICWVNGEPYCERCVTRCDECGHYHLNDEITRIERRHSTYYVCDDCLNNGDFTWCDECETWHYSDDCTYIPSEDISVCNVCRDRWFSQCDNCGEYVRDENILSTEDCCHYCKSCYDDIYTMCNNCGCLVERASLVEIDGKEYCKECYEYAGKEMENEQE